MKSEKYIPLFKLELDHIFCNLHSFAVRWWNVPSFQQRKRNQLGKKSKPSSDQVKLSQTNINTFSEKRKKSSRIIKESELSSLTLNKDLPFYPAKNSEIQVE